MIKPHGNPVVYRMVTCILICTFMNRLIQFQVADKLDHMHKKRKFKVQNSKKINCPAYIVIREVHRYPAFKVSLHRLHGSGNDHMFQ